MLQTEELVEERLIDSQIYGRTCMEIGRSRTSFFVLIRALPSTDLAQGTAADMPTT